LDYGWKGYILPYTNTDRILYMNPDTMYAEIKERSDFTTADSEATYMFTFNYSLNNRYSFSISTTYNDETYYLTFDSDFLPYF
jgi:hypothetical protein